MLGAAVTTASPGWCGRWPIAADWRAAEPWPTHQHPGVDVV